MPESTLAVIGEGLVELRFDQAGDSLRHAPGGDAGNIAAMAGRLGAPVRLAGRVGADPFGARLLAFWRSCGVDVAHVRIDDGAATGLYLNTPAGDGHRFTYWRTGSAGSRLAPHDLADAFLAGVGIVVVTGITLAVSASSAAAADHAMRRARRDGARVACVVNHRPALGGDTAALAAVASGADVLIGSAEDMLAVFGDDDARKLSSWVAVRELVVTAGERPATAVVDGAVVTVPPPPVELVDAAGAGDAFAGSYLSCRLRGASPGVAVAWGVAAAARAVTRAGCAASYPTRSETAALADELLAVAR